MRFHRIHALMFSSTTGWPLSRPILGDSCYTFKRVFPLTNHIYTSCLLCLHPLYLPGINSPQKTLNLQTQHWACSLCSTHLSFVWHPYTCIIIPTPPPAFVSLWSCYCYSSWASKHWPASGVTHCLAAASCMHYPNTNKPCFLCCCIRCSRCARP